MRLIKNALEIISAPSVLGLKPAGVQDLAASLLSSGLAEYLNSEHLINVPTLNALYSNQRDPETNCLNARPIRDFSLTLEKVVSGTLSRGHFAFVLGGDCSILIGIMPALKRKGMYGLVFLDAHADFYGPESSLTGEVADMELAIITGRGPELLTNIDNLKPYVKDENVIHIGQRDWEETKRYGSLDIRETAIKCLSLAEIERYGIKAATREILHYINQLDLEGWWIHLDTDVLSDQINPAVDYRLPGGLSFEQVERLLSSILSTGKARGMSVTIFNPALDQDGHISKNIVASLGRAFDFATITK